MKNGQVYLNLELYFLRYLSNEAYDEDSVLMVTLRSGDLKAIANATNQKLLNQEEFLKLSEKRFGNAKKYDLKQGVGIYYEGDLRRMEGTGRDTWFFEGYGKCLDAHGNYYEGEWVGNKYDGQGKLISLDGEIKEGKFKNGIFMGRNNNNGGGRNNNNSNGSLEEGDSSNISRFVSNFNFGYFGKFYEG